MSMLSRALAALVRSSRLLRSRLRRRRAAQPPLPATPPFQMAPPPPAPMAKGADKQSEIQQAIDEARIDREVDG